MPKPSNNPICPQPPLKPTTSHSDYATGNPQNSTSKTNTMAPSVTIRTQPPSRVQQNTTMTPSPELRVEFDNTDPRASRAGEMIFHGQLRSAAGNLIAGLHGSSAHVSLFGHRVFMDSTFSGIRIADKGTYYLDLTVNFIDETGGLTLGNVITNYFEVY